MTAPATQTLTDWLLDRIAEDEAVARAVDTGRWYPWDERNGELGAALRDLRPAAAAHIARHDPARVLAECAAFRAIVEQAQRQLARPGQDPMDGGADDAYDEVLRALASIYADRDGWRAEWGA